MIADIQNIPIDERIQLVEDIWDSIADEHSLLPLTKDQKEELDSRLNAYKLDGLKGRKASDVILSIKEKL